MNNRYSLVVNRIRLLNEEKRRLMNKIGEQQSSTDDNIRLESIATQLNALVFRVKLGTECRPIYTSGVDFCYNIFTVWNFFLPCNRKVKLLYHHRISIGDAVRFNWRLLCRFGD